MLSTEPALSTVAVKPKITAFKTPSNNGKDFIRLYEYAGWSESSLDLLVIL